MRFNKFILAFCLWFTVYAGQAAAVDTNDGSVDSTAIANANAVTVKATYIVVSDTYLRRRRQRLCAAQQ